MLKTITSSFTTEIYFCCRYDIFDRSLLHITLHDGKDSRSLPVFHYALTAARQRESPTLCRSWVNLRGAMGYTALFYACKAGLTECVTALIEAGADINKSSDFERLTPLMVAVKEGRLETVRTLVRLGKTYYPRPIILLVTLQLKIITELEVNHCLKR